MGIPVYERIHPLRKPKGFEPVVQRWSAAFVNSCRALGVAFHGVQGKSWEEIGSSDFLPWLGGALAGAEGPTVMDHARFVDGNSLHTHIVAAYWVDVQRRDRFFARPDVRAWWEHSDRSNESTGYFRESMTVPIDRQESIYWQDYAGGLSASPDIALYPTPYCGYYGAMRDRIPLAAVDPLESPLAHTGLTIAERATKGGRWRVTVPNNFAVIRSAAFWGRCDPDQTADYVSELRTPLESGMAYLDKNAEASGCASLRFQQTCDQAGNPAMETHALGYFLSLGHLEDWAERHPSHGAIFNAAISRYRKYGRANQLRTWHEVFVLPDNEPHEFEYVNCAPGTGLLNFLDARRL